MPTNQDRVRQFHARFGLPLRPSPVDHLPAEERMLRDALLAEEVREYREARGVAARAKEAADILDVLYGDACHYGYDLDAVVAEVHRSNLTKDGGSRHDGKILKGPGYQRPDVDAVLSAARGEPAP
jgi:predicted HAD superfamily Cof-like phosphohydrolase